MKIYWNEKTGAVIKSPQGGRAVLLRKQGWKYTRSFGDSAAYPYGPPYELVFNSDQS